MSNKKSKGIASLSRVVRCWVRLVPLVGFTKFIFSAVDYSSMSAIKPLKLVS